MGKRTRKKKEAPPPPLQRRAFPWPLLAVMLLPWLLYVDTLNAGFVWDDHLLVQMNASRHSAADFVKAWSSDFWQTDRSSNHSEYYRPLTNSSFMLDYALHDGSARGYHFTNILIYSVVCGLAYLLFKRMAGSSLLALLLGLVFAALPAHTENVCWISGRTDLMCAAFMFAAMLAYLIADETDRTGWWVASVALFLLSLFGKEMSITLIAVVGLHQWLGHGLSRRAVLRTLPFAGAAAVFWVLHSLAAPHIQPENIYTTPASYVLNVLRNLGLGIWYSLAPGGFQYLVTATREQAARDFAIPQGLHLAAVLLPLAACLAGMGVALWKREKAVAFALGSGLIALLPVSGVIPIGVVFAVRFLLIPGFFFLLAAGLMLDKTPRRVTIGGMSVPLNALVLVPFIAAYTVITFLRAPAWRDDATLMRTVLAHQPDAALAHFILGNALAGQGNEADAMAHYEKALQERPEYPEAEFNLGVLAQKQGDTARAETLYRRAIAHKPEFRQARMTLAQLLMASGRKEEAYRLIKEDPLAPKK
ncbi:MAG TPA: tetratricopeptide repeat protein [bacterium]|nr:tetratricopeptide repeat protein [bacterium]